MKPFLKFYLKKNPRFGTEKERFVSSSIEEYERVMDAGISNNRFTCYEDWVEEMQIRHYESEDNIIRVKVVLASIEISSEEKLKELKENGLEDPNFIEWANNDW